MPTQRIMKDPCHQSIISIEDVSFAYANKPVFEHVNFTLQERDFVGMVGSNGSGKTTLLKMIVGLLKPDQGEIRLFGQAISQFTDWESIGYVPQKNSFNLLFPATVKDVVLSGLYGRKKLYRRIKKTDLQKCEDALHAMGIADLYDRRIGQLSGGQQQRVFLARALINNPALLILDEPTVGIDAETQIDFFQMVKHMHQHHNITFLMVSHDMEMISSYLGAQPVQINGRLKFFVKHSHQLEDCDETNLSHTLQDLRTVMDSL